MTVAVVAALPEEIAPLARRLGVALPRAGERAVAAGVGRRDLRLLATGDGARSARASLAALLAEAPVEAVLGLGLAGGLTADLSVGELVVIETVVDEASRRSWRPASGPWGERGRRAGAAHAAAGAAARGAATAVSAVAIATTPAAKARLAPLAGGAATRVVVDLETAVWCEVCDRAGVPLVVARWVSDGADEALPLDFEACRDAGGAVDRRRVVRAALARPASWRALWRLRRRLERAGEDLATWALEVLAG